MKKTILIFLIICLTINCFCDDYTIENIPAKYLGIWIPVIFDTDFKKSNIYTHAYNLIQTKKAHDLLIIEKNSIRSNRGFNDGYAIKKTEYEKYIFRRIEGTLKLFDDNGNEYIMIGYGSNYKEIFEKYILEIINKKILALSKKNQLRFSDNAIFITSQEPELGPYELLLNLTFLYRNDIPTSYYNIFLYNKAQNNFFGMKILTDSICFDQFIQKTTFIGKSISKIEVEKVTIITLK